MYTPPGTPRSRSLMRLTMRVGLPHLGQSVDFVVSITFLRSPVFAILAIGRVFLLLGGVSAHTLKGTERGFNVAVLCSTLDAKRLHWRERDSLPSVYMKGHLLAQFG